MVDVTRGSWRRRITPFLEALWPSGCVLCGGVVETSRIDLCAACRGELPMNEPACVRCADALTGSVGLQLTCGQCLRHPPRFDAARCVLRYAYPVDHLVRGLKYGGAAANGRVLGELLALHVSKGRDEPLPSLMIPVPLAQGRYCRRGYNQAIELGRSLEKRLQVPLRCDLVVRTRETLEQAGLKKRARRKNVRGAFALTGKLPAPHVAIIDDVVTTGSTVNELARVLKRAGARRVEVWAAARAG
jgi:ComF family protein